MKKRPWNIALAITFVAIVVVFAIGIVQLRNKEKASYDDGIEVIDPNTIKFSDSNVEVHFSDVILSSQNETRKLIVSEQEATVSTELTHRVIEVLDLDLLKKTQTVHYTSKGYFVVDLDKLTKSSIVEDSKKKTVTIKIDHAYLEAITIDANDIIIDEVNEGLLDRGDIQLTLQDYNTIEKELQNHLEAEFNTTANAQAADDLALKMVKEIYEPVVKAVDKNYDVIVEFK